MLDPRNFSFADVVSLLAVPELKEIDQQVGEAIGLKIIPVESVSKWNLLAEVSQAGFPVDEVKGALVSKKAEIVDFGIRWNRLCDQVDHGEEFDPAKGNQQEDARVVKVGGLGEGAAVTYVLFLLYAAIGQKELVSYLKRRRIPHASKVAADIMSIVGKR